MASLKARCESTLLAKQQRIVRDIPDLEWTTIFLAKRNIGKIMEFNRACIRARAR